VCWNRTAQIVLIVAALVAFAVLPITRESMPGILVSKTLLIGVGQGGLIVAYEFGGWTGDPPEFVRILWRLEFPRNQLADHFFYVPLWTIGLVCGIAAFAVRRLGRTSSANHCVCGYPLAELPVSASGRIICPECGRSRDASSGQA
jgi:hypothetical protein